MCGNKNVKKNEFEFVRKGTFNLCISLIILFSCLMLVTGAVTFVTKMNYLFEIIEWVFIATIIFGALMIWNIYRFKSQYAYTIEAVKCKKNKYIFYEVYADNIVLYNDGTFSCGKNVKLDYDYNEENDYLDEYLMENSGWQFNFFLKVYDNKNKKYLTQEDYKKIIIISEEVLGRDVVNENKNKNETESKPELIV